MNLRQVSRRMSSNKFADAGSRYSSRGLVRTLRVFKEWDPERLCKVLQMTRRRVSYDLFQRVECKQPFRIILLDEVNNKRKEQLQVPNRDIT